MLIHGFFFPIHVFMPIAIFSFLNRHVNLTRSIQLHTNFTLRCSIYSASFPPSMSGVNGVRSKSTSEAGTGDILLIGECGTRVEGLETSTGHGQHEV